MDKSKATMNKLIEDGLRDKRQVDQLRQIISDLEKQLKKKQRKISKQEVAMLKIEQDLDEVQKQVKNEFDQNQTQKKENQAFQKLLSDLMRQCGI